MQDSLAVLNHHSAWIVATLRGSTQHTHAEVVEQIASNGTQLTHFHSADRLSPQ